MHKPRLLVIGDDEAIQTEFRSALAEDYEIAAAEDRDTALRLLTSERPHVVILDPELPASDGGSGEGFSLLEEILDLEPLTRVVVVTESDNHLNAVRATDMGAFDYHLKPVDIGELKVILRRALHLRTIDEKTSRVNSRGLAAKGETPFPEVLGSSRQMFSIFSTIDRAARTDATVLVTGESGTGKELVARAIHAKSTRRDAPFIPVSCGVIPETLIESELFDHEKGAFTGAHVRRKGKLEVADGGTVFLDGISESSAALQVRLLQFLQEREQTPPAVRIIAASDTDLSKSVENGSFRKDLYYRLAAIIIPLPPLRERGDDGVLLAKFFLEKVSQEMGRRPRRFSQEAEEAIRSYAWPGNVRELQNRIKRAIIMARGRVITPTDLDVPSPLLEASVISLREAREQAERRTIIAALERTRGNISRAAAEIRVSRPTLHGLLEKYDLQAKKFRQ